MNQRFPPAGFSEVASTSAPKTLYDCLPGATVMLRGQALYLGEFRQGIDSGAPRVHEHGNYALLWQSRAHYLDDLPYLILAASRSHQVAVPPPMTRDVVTALRKAA